MTVRAPIAVALDAPDVATAKRWAAAVEGSVSTLKLGLEFVLRSGQPGVSEVMDHAPDCDLFLDLKLHDIPKTMAGAARSVATLRPRLLTVHAMAGSAGIAAVCEALPDTEIAAVTVLTSMSDADLDELGFAADAKRSVLRLAAMAVNSGARALVCSPHEVSEVRATVGPDVRLITPGVRPAGDKPGDQHRVATPEQARAAGSDLLVIGRPITGAREPGAVAANLALTVR